MASDLSLLKSTVADVLGLQGTVAEEQANAQAENLQATGATAEADAYQQAADISTKTAGTAQVLGDLQKAQEQRKLYSTLGTAAANTGANGFGDTSGSAIALLRDSVQRGALGQQLIDVQTGQNIAGYLEQSSAALAEKSAVNAQVGAANSLATAETTAANVAAANAANESTALQQFLALNPPQTAEQQAAQDVVTSTLTSPLNGPAALPQTAQPGTDLANFVPQQPTINGQPTLANPGGTPTTGIASYGVVQTNPIFGSGGTKPLAF